MNNLQTVNKGENWSPLCFMERAHTKNLQDSKAMEATLYVNVKNGKFIYSCYRYVYITSHINSKIARSMFVFMGQKSNTLSACCNTWVACGKGCVQHGSMEVSKCVAMNVSSQQDLYLAR